MKTIKRAIILLFLFTAAGAMRVYAAEPTFSFDSNVRAIQGETVTMPVNVYNNPGFCAAGLIIYYHASVLELVEVTGLVSAMPLSQFALSAEAGIQWVSLVNRDLVDWSGSGAVVDVVFRVRPGAQLGNTPVTLEFTNSPDGTPANANGDLLRNASTVSGSINVVESATQNTPAHTLAPTTPPALPPASDFSTPVPTLAPISANTPVPAPATEPTPNSNSNTADFGRVPQTGVPGMLIPIVAISSVLLLSILLCIYLLRRKNTDKNSGKISGKK